MNVFVHKETGELAIARKIWLESDIPEIPELGHSIQVNVSEAAIAFENKYGVIFVMPLQVLEHFEDLGEL